MHTKNTKVDIKQLATGATGAKCRAEEAVNQARLKGMDGLKTCNA